MMLCDKAGQWRPSIQSIVILPRYGYDAILYGHRIENMRAAFALCARPTCIIHVMPHYAAGSRPPLCIHIRITPPITDMDIAVDRYAGA